MDRESGAKIERRSFVLPVQSSCPEDWLPGPSASPASPPKTHKALQLYARKQPPACAFVCRPVEFVESSILLPSVARGKETASDGQMNEKGSGSPSRYSKRRYKGHVGIEALALYTMGLTSKIPPRASKVHLGNFCPRRTAPDQGLYVVRSNC
jgi:hypothetical protein